MTPTRTSIGMICVGIFSISCQMLPLAEFPTPDPGWEMYVSDDLQNPTCPDISGLYDPQPEKLVYESGVWKAVEVTRFGIAEFHPHAQQVDKISSSVELEESLGPGLPFTGWFGLAYPAANQLILDYPAPALGNVARVTWYESEGEYSCSGGRLDFEASVDLGGSEGPDGNSQTVVTFGLSEENSLLVYSVTSLAKPSLRTRGFPNFKMLKYRRLEIDELE